MPTPPDCFLMTSRDDVIPSRFRSARLPVDPARRLDLEADAELQQGHHARAELLAHRAAMLRGWQA